MALFQQHTESDNCLWAIWKVDESPEQLLSLLPHSETYRQSIARFASPNRRLEWLAVRVLLYVLLGEDPEIRYRNDGKPYWADGSRSLSISHTRGYVAVIVGHPDQEVGIDIEQYGERVRKVASRFMHPDETASVYNGTDIWGLLLHWSAKETLFKCLNETEVDFQEHLRIYPFSIEESDVIQAVEYRTPKKQRFRIHYRLFPDFVLTFCF